jgi:hypothetical protein
LTARFLDHDTGAPFVHPGFGLTVWDIDEGQEKSSMESFTIGPVAGLYQNEFTNYSLEQLNNTFYQVKSTIPTESNDNPISTNDVTERQARKSCTFTFAGVSEFYMVLASGSGFGGRNFDFSGGSDMLSRLAPTAAPTAPPTVAPTGCTGSCTVWGDPHVLPFDVASKRLKQHPRREGYFRTRSWKEDQVSVYDEGVFWLVKSELVHIQARYENNGTGNALVALAVGGPFLRDNTLMINPLSGGVFWNHHAILEGLPSEFCEEVGPSEVFHAKYTEDAEVVKDGSLGRGIDVRLPMGVQLMINRWDHSLAAAIRMCPQLGGQDGQCGDFDGSVEGDTSAAILSRMGERVRLEERVRLSAEASSNLFSMIAEKIRESLRRGKTFLDKLAGPRAGARVLRFSECPGDR